MLTKTDISQICSVVKGEIKPVMRDVKALKKDVSQIRRDIKRIFSFFDSEYL